MQYKTVAIIGGGMAGLAAAAKLTQSGVKVTLFEASANLGGRARRVDYNGLALDNGQHILLGAYQETLALLRLANVDIQQAFMRLPLQLHMQDLLSQKTFTLKSCNLLPAPLPILAGLLLAKGLPLGSRISALKLMVWMKLHQFKLPQDQDLSLFLRQKNQPQDVIRTLWEPLCLAALNTPIALASTQVFLNVLRDSFAHKKSDSDLLLPRSDLTTLLAEPLANYIKNNGGEIITGTAVKNIEPSSNGFIVEKQLFSHLIMACAPHQLSLFNLPFSEPVQDFTYQPITTVYLQYNQQITLPRIMTGFVNSLAQWAFDKGQLSNQAGLIAVVISAHTPFETTHEALIEKITLELQTAFPALEKPLWAKVITEKRATFSCNTHLVRPTAITQYKNGWLAGDYIAGDYPATIEGAVRSSTFVANLIINSKTYTQ